MSNLNSTDIQGFVLRGYNLPVARYFFLHFQDAARGRALIGRLLHEVTTGQRWEGAKPDSTLNIAFTHRGLEALALPAATLLSFPVEFQQGMQARAAVLGDVGVNSPEHWDPVWREGRVHCWIAINAQDTEALDRRSAAFQSTLEQSGGTLVVATQDAAAQMVNGKPTTSEHFGFTDGFGNYRTYDNPNATPENQGENGSWTRMTEAP